MQKNKNILLNSFIVICFILLFFYILIIWAGLLQPLVIAFIISAALISLSNFYKKLFSKIKYLPCFLRWFFSIILSIWTYVFAFWIITKTLETNFLELKSIIPQYQNILSIKIDNLQTYLDSLWTKDTWYLKHINLPTKTQDFFWYFKDINLTKWATTVFGEITKIFTQIFTKTTLIMVYVMFILLESKNFKKKLDLIFKNSQKKQHFSEVMDKINSDIKSYFVVKTIVSFLTAFFSYLIMLILRLDLALFWATIIFLLNFIPTVWSIIASLLPMLLSLIQFETIYPFIILTVWLFGVQQLMWGFLEPRYMWNKLNLSPFVIIISLWIWGNIWGLLGMLLSVPFMVITNIILSKFESTRPIAILLSEKWNLYIENYVWIEIDKKKLLDDVKKRIDIVKKLNR